MNAFLDLVEKAWSKLFPNFTGSLEIHFSKGVWQKWDKKETGRAKK